MATVAINLRGKKGAGRVALIDASDSALVSHMKWYLDVNKNRKALYARANTKTSEGRSTTILMHRVICPDSIEVDHINGDGLDNRRLNLRPADSTSNKHNTTRRQDNTSGYKGVGWHKGHGKWRARIRVEGKSITLGYFASPQAASAAYALAAQEHFGGFANFTKE